MALEFNESEVSRLLFSGQNLQPIKDWSSREINGVVCSIQKGTGYLNGLSTAGSWQRVESQAISLSPGTYTLYFFTNWNSNYIGLGLYNSNHQDLYQINTQRYKSFTLTSTETFDIIFWWNDSGFRFENIYIQSMLKRGEYDPSVSFDPYGPDNEVMTLIKDGEVVWKKPFTFSTSFSGVQSSDWSARVVSTQEPTSSPRDIASGSRIYFDDSVSFTCLDGVRTRVTTYWEYSGELSVSSTDVSSLFTGNYGFTYTNNNDTTVTVYWYAEYYPDPNNPYGTKTRTPSSGWSNAGNVASSQARSVTGCIPAISAGRNIYIKVSKVDYQRQDTNTNTYSGGDASGITNKNTSTTIVEPNLNRKTITGVVDDNVVLSLTRVDDSTSQRTGTTRTIESNTYVFYP